MKPHVKINLYLLTSSLVFFVVCFFHLHKLDQIGKGVYIDESSIGLNAALISKTLRDEHGEFLPLYFKAFGDYRAPIYLYATAVVFKLAGISVFNLRLTSFIFFTVAYLASAYLTWKIFRKDRFVTVYYLLAFGFLPQYFTLSRTAFEVISQLAVMSLFLLAFYSALKTSKHKPFLFGMSGLLLGGSIYTYNTSKIMSFLIFGISLIIFFRELALSSILKRQFMPLLSYFLGFIFAVLPFIYLVIFHPEIAVDRRFKLFAQTENKEITINERGKIFAKNYLKALSPSFLIGRGDINLRHHAPYGSLVFKTVYVFFIAGLIFTILNFKNAKWPIFLFAIFLISIISGPLTNDPTHSLRGFLAGVCVTLISCYGLFSLTLITKPNISFSIMVLALGVLLVEIYYYQINYFVNFPNLSVHAFESNGFVEAFEQAQKFNPEKIILSERVNQPPGHFKFFNQVKQWNNSYKVEIGPVTAYPKSCFLYIPENQIVLDRESRGHLYVDYVEPDWFYKARCFY